MGIKKDIFDLVGNTPLLELGNFSKSHGLTTPLLGKLEGYNPTGSMKDRIARQMILDLEESKKIVPGKSVLIEPTSGNTGIGLAAMGIAKGYRVILTMPESMSLERRKMLSVYGAELVLTPASLGMKGAIEKANQLSSEIPNSIIMGQFVNPSNPKAHYLSTGPEIYEDCEGKLDILVSAVGTGGSLSGTSKYLKERIPGLKVVAVEPAKSPVISGGKPGPHGIQGIGAGFIPYTLDKSLIDEVIAITDEEAFATARELPKSDGIFVGISSGAALSAALKVAKRPENAGKRIVILLPDSGDRYLSSPLFE